MKLLNMVRPKVWKIVKPLFRAPAPQGRGTMGFRIF